MRVFENINDDLLEISNIINKNIVLNIDIDIDQKFLSVFHLSNENDVNRFKTIIRNSYVRNYLDLLKEYKSYYKEGTGNKTNGYHESGQNYAYNYFEYPNFLMKAKKYNDYDDKGNSVGSSKTYSYYKNVWSAACDRVVKQYGYKFDLKFDHRHKDQKNNDFDGTLVLFELGNRNYWKMRNLPNKQRYM